MTIRSSEYFSYAGKLSSELGILNVNIDGGLLEEPFLPEREIREVYVRGNHKPYFQGLELKPLSFNVTFAFEDTWTDDHIEEIARWLNQPYYQELYFSRIPNRRFFAIPINATSLIHNGANQGYITIPFRCNSPFTYSPMTEQIFNFENNETYTDLTFVNDGSMEIKPELWITKIGNGDVSIVNLNNTNKPFTFTALENNEEVYIDSENEHIETSIPDTYRHDNFSMNFLELAQGRNILRVYGKCHLKFLYRTIRLQS